MDDPKGSSHIKCIICLQASRNQQDILLEKTSLSNHQRSQVHLATLRKSGNILAVNPDHRNLPVDRALQNTIFTSDSVALSMAECFMQEMGFTEQEGLPADTPMPFDDVEYLEDNWWDSTGKPVEFTIEM
jgi:hypothetical protein